METIQPTLHVAPTAEFETATISSPLTGQVKTLSEIEDEVFSSGMLGDGIAIEPTSGQVVSPVDGTVSSVFPTKHAIGITSDEGVEILIHIGMDTVSLNGDGFENFVQQNDRVTKGMLIARVDLDKLKAAGFSTITPVVITNTGDYKKVSTAAHHEIKQGDLLLTIER